MQWVLFIFFWLLSALRDVWAEILLKIPGSHISPMWILFVDGLAAQIIALCIIGRAKNFTLSNYQPVTKISWLLFLYSFFTFAAFLTYYLAIQTPLGAPLTSLVAYGLDPIVTTGLAAILLGEKLDRNYWWAAAGCILGLAILNYPLFAGLKVEAGWWVGFGLALVNTVLFGLYVVCTKKLIIYKIPNAVLVFYRMVMSTLVLAAWLFMRPIEISSGELLLLILHGLLTFAAPLFIIIYLLTRYTVRKVVILLFLIPVVTALVGSAFGVNKLSTYDILAFVVTLAAVTYYQLKSQPAQCSEF